MFELYGDPSLNDALDVTLRLALSIPLNHLMAYQKVARAYFQLIEVGNVSQRMLSSPQQALATDTSVSFSACDVRIFLSHHHRS